MHIIKGIGPTKRRPQWYIANMSQGNIQTNFEMSLNYISDKIFNLISFQDASQHGYWYEDELCTVVE